MIVTGYRPNEEKEFDILKDYYNYVDKKEGVLFVLSNPEGNFTFSRFLPRNQMNNNYEWTKSSGDVHYTAAGIESGTENKLIEEVGFIKIKSKTNSKEKKYTYRKYRFIIKKED